MKVLNLGCGNAKMKFPEVNEATEVVGVDLSKNSQADIIHNLDVLPYPFEDDTFDLVIMQDVMEHLEDVPGALSEVYRIAKEGGIVRIRTPHYSSYYAYNDPTHKRFFGIYFLDHFDADQPNLLYSAARFRIVKRTVEFPRLWRVTGIAWLSNKYHHRWEQMFAFIFRAGNMIFELEAVKS